MFKPGFDRVLLRPVKEPDAVNGIVRPDKYTESDKYEVVAVGSFVVISGLQISMSEFAAVGDIALVAEYNVEAIELDGEYAGQKLFLARALDIRGREKHVANRSRAAA